MFGRTDEAGAAAAEYEATLVTASAEAYKVHVEARAAFLKAHPTGTAGLLDSFRSQTIAYFNKRRKRRRFGQRKEPPFETFLEPPSAMMGFFFTGDDE